MGEVQIEWHIALSKECSKRRTKKGCLKNGKAKSCKADSTIQSLVPDSKSGRSKWASSHPEVPDRLQRLACCQASFLQNDHPEVWEWLSKCAEHPILYDGYHQAYVWIVFHEVQVGCLEIWEDWCKGSAATGCRGFFGWPKHAEPITWRMTIADTTHDSWPVHYRSHMGHVDFL